MVVWLVSQHDDAVGYPHRRIKQRLQSPGNGGGGDDLNGFTAGLLECRLELDGPLLGGAGIGGDVTRLDPLGPLGLQQVEDGGETAGLLLVRLAIEKQAAKADLGRWACRVSIKGKAGDMLGMLPCGIFDGGTNEMPPALEPSFGRFRPVIVQAGIAKDNGVEGTKNVATVVVGPGDRVCVLERSVLGIRAGPQRGAPAGCGMRDRHAGQYCCR